MRLHNSLPFIFLLLVTSALAQNASSLVDDDDDDTCMSSNGYYECDIFACPCPFLLPHQQIVQYLSYISPIFTFILIIGFLAMKELREQPGDFFIGFAVAEAALGLTSLFEILYDKKTNYGVTMEPEVCMGISVLRVFFRRTIRTYHVSYVIYYLISLRYSLKSFNVPIFFYHLIPWFTGVGLVALEYLRGGLGKSLQGTCDLKSSSRSSRYIVELGLYLFCFILSTCLIPRLLRKSGNLFPEIKKHFQYYLSYFIFANILLIVTFIAKFYEAETFDMFIHTENPVEAQDYILTTFKYEEVVIVIDQISPIVLTLVRLADPFLRKHWVKLFKNIFCCGCFRRKRKISEGKLKNQELGISLTETVEDMESSRERDRLESMNASQVRASLIKKPFLVQAQHNKRTQVVYSFLAAIHYHLKVNVRKQSLVASSSKDDAYYNKKAKAKTQHFITDELIDTTLPDVIKEVRSKNHSILPGKLTVYAPDIFEEITQMDGMSSNLIDSLDLGKNFNRISKSGKAAGGRGGEFFFFSNDNRLILKTANTKELKTLLGILPRYSRHFELNPKSIIAKIYAVFTFEIQDPYEEYHLILMKNVNGYPSSCVERKYDLKGSTVDRAVLDDSKLDIANGGLKFAGIMKDKDFDKYEERLHIEESLQYDLLDTLVRDVAFFRMEGLIDYSLVVYLVDKNKVGVEDVRKVSLEDENNTSSLLTQGGTPAVAHPLLSIKSTKEELYYHIGIIDYLSKYDWKKRIEKWYKQTKALNFGLDTSCQDPHTYNRRFLGYMEKIILESISG